MFINHPIKKRKKEKKRHIPEVLCRLCLPKSMSSKLLTKYLPDNELTILLLCNHRGEKRWQKILFYDETKNRGTT